MLRGTVTHALAGWPHGSSSAASPQECSSRPHRFPRPSASAAPAPLTFTETWIQDLPQRRPVRGGHGLTGRSQPRWVPAVEVGDRSGRLYAFIWPTGHRATGWSNGTGRPWVLGKGAASTASTTACLPSAATASTVAGNPPIDSTASTIAGAGGASTVYFDAGNAAAPVTGGYYAYKPTGPSYGTRW